MLYENVCDTRLVELLEINGSELCMEVARRWRELLDDEVEEIEKPESPYFPVVLVQNNLVRFRIDTNTTIEVPTTEIQGEVSLGALLVVGDSGKFKVWTPTK